MAGEHMGGSLVATLAPVALVVLILVLAVVTVFGIAAVTVGREARRLDGVAPRAVERHRALQADDEAEDAGHQQRPVRGSERGARHHQAQTNEPGPEPRQQADGGEGEQVQAGPEAEFRDVKAGTQARGQAVAVEEDMPRLGQPAPEAEIGIVEATRDRNAALAPVEAFAGRLVGITHARYLSRRA